jgi:mxaA protein
MAQGWLAVALCCVTLCCVALCTAQAQSPPADAAIRIRIEEPRPYGHVLGDVIDRRIRLPVDAVPAAAALPRPGRIDAWLELRSAELQTDAAGAELQLRYQIVNSPTKVLTIALPALRLAPAAGGPPAEIAPWPITVAPITPPFVLARAGLDAMQPDVQPQREPLQPIALRLMLWLGLLVPVAWLLAARRWPQMAFWRRDAPFRDALADLRRIAARARPASPEHYRDALERMHRAFDGAAGRALFADTLAPLYARRPALRHADAAVQAFYAESRRVFFGSSEATTDSAAGLKALVVLCRRLAQLEAERAG